MDQTLLLGAVIRFVESHIRGTISYRELERAVGFSYRHIREEFRRYMGIPLKQYINSRKIAGIAAGMAPGVTLTTLAADYGFESYDTFTRCFKRETGMTPSQCRKSGGPQVRRGLIAMGAYAPVLEGLRLPVPRIPAAKDGVTLYGVPKIEYMHGKCTPFPAALESALAYLGEGSPALYPRLMAASGAAFRLCWRPGGWDLASVSLPLLSPAEPWRPFREACAAAGRRCTIIERDSTSKEVVWQAVTENLSRGVPVIALGIVGPPEACILTGFQEPGAKLLGWSFFQDNPEFSGEAADPSGYFITGGWWENPATLAFVFLEETAGKTGDAQIIQRAGQVLAMERAGAYLAGQAAYSAWADDVLNDEFYRPGTVDQILLSRALCLADAETALGEGRYWGARYFEGLAAGHPEAKLCRRAARDLDEVARCAWQMTALRGEGNLSGETLQRLCDPTLRRELARLINRAAALERQAAASIEKILCPPSP